LWARVPLDPEAGAIGLKGALRGNLEASLLLLGHVLDQAL